MLGTRHSLSASVMCWQVGQTGVSDLTSWPLFQRDWMRTGFDWFRLSDQTDCSVVLIQKTWSPALDLEKLRSLTALLPS